MDPISQGLRVKPSQKEFLIKNGEVDGFKKYNDCKKSGGFKNDDGFDKTDGFNKTDFKVKKFRKNNDFEKSKDFKMMTALINLMILGLKNLKRLTIVRRVEIS